MIKQLNAVITGISASVPEYILTNEELSTMVDTTDEWIMTNLFIKVDFPTLGLPTKFTKPDLCPIISPFQINTSPRESGTKRSKNYIVTFSKFRFPLPQTEGYCTSTGITILLDIYHYFFR
jgi:hypothetical protein